MNRVEYEQHTMFKAVCSFYCTSLQLYYFHLVYHKVLWAFTYITGIT